MGIRLRTPFYFFAAFVMGCGISVPANSAPAQDHEMTWHFTSPSTYTYFSEVLTLNKGGNSLVELKRLPNDAFWKIFYKDPRPKHGPEYHTFALDPDRNIVAVGETADFSTDTWTSELLICKYNQKGQRLSGWPRLFAGKGYRWNEGHDVAIDASGDITVVGYTITNSNKWTFAVWRFDANGTILAGWPRYPVGSHAYGTGVIIDSNGDVIACGGAGPHAKEQIVLMKYKKNGSPVAGWPKTFKAIAHQQTFAYDIIRDSDRNLVVAGYAQDTRTKRDALLYKLNKNGTVLAGWPKLWDSGLGLDDEYYSVSQDANGDYCLVGSSQDASSKYHLLVTRYDKKGNELTSSGWPQIVPFLGGFADYIPPPDAWHGSVDTSGNISASYTSQSLAEIRTVKYTVNAAKFKGFPKILSRPGYENETRSCGVDDLDNIYSIGYSLLGADYSTFLVKYPPASYSTGRPAVSTNQGIKYTKLISFAETLGPGNTGKVAYQLSPDATNWYYHNGTKWTKATTKQQTNAAADINSRLGTFTQEVGIGTLYVKAFLISNGSQVVRLDSMSVTYDD